MVLRQTAGGGERGPRPLGAAGSVRTVPTDVGPRGRPPGPLVEIEVGDDPVDWASLGFAVIGGVATVGTVRLRFAGAGDERGRGIVGWTLRDVGVPAGDVDGLPTAYVVDAVDAVPSSADAPEHAAGAAGATGATGAARRPDAAPSHPNRVTRIDHIVVATPDLDRTTAALATVGLEPRRTREAGGGRLQRFFRMGEVILEVVGPAAPAGDAPARFWGLAFTVADIEATTALLAGRLGTPREAVQQGRRIATVRTGSEVSVPVALMSPAPDGPPRSGR